MKSDLSFQLESAAWPAFIVDVGGTIRHANQAAIAFFGPKLEGETIPLSALWAEQNESAGQFLTRWERSATSVIPLHYHGKGGAVALFATHICPMRGAQKRYVFQLLREPQAQAEPENDLSRLGVAESKPGQGETGFFQKQRLDCAVQLTRGVAVDFNNALTTILGHTSLVLGQMPPDHPSRPSLTEVEKAVERAAEITQHLAAFSRQEKQPPHHAQGNLNTVLRRVIEGLQKTAPPTIRWQVQLADCLYSVKFDESKVQQALTKIIDNAVDAVSERGAITLSTRNLDITEPTQDRAVRLAPGSHVCIEISDDGPGISPDDLPRIFEPFFSTKWGHRGLGLAWVYGIVTNHRGGVAVSSVYRQGTSVRVYLPATQEFVSEPLVLPPDNNNRQTILIVDDEDLLLAMGRTVLTAFGYQVLTANSGRQALEIIDQTSTPIDLIITDLVMPQMSGRDLIDQVLPRLPGVPILRTSGYVLHGVEEGHGAFLQKPFTSQTLLRRVRQLLDESDSPPEEAQAG